MTASDGTAHAGDRSREVLLVVGSGRSGTSLVTSLLREVGWTVPQPEVPPNESNPNGFAEPQWLVDFHEASLERFGVDNQDPRPEAWEIMSQAYRDRRLEDRLARWLGRQFLTADRLVLKDPRAGWFLPIHQTATARVQGRLGLITSLRTPSEAIASRQLAYGEGVGPAALTAAWVNVMLRTEHQTRGSRRAFVHHSEMLGDWRSALQRAADQLAMDAFDGTTQEAGDEVIDPALKRATPGWKGLGVPPALADLADAVFASLSALTSEPAQERALGELDQLRSEYDAYYTGCRAVAMFEVFAARDRIKRHPRRFRDGALRWCRRVFNYW